MTLNGVNLFLQKGNIRKILSELKILFDSRNRENEDSKKMKVYLDGYNRVVKVFTVITILGNLIVGAFWIPYLING